MTQALDAVIEKLSTLSAEDQERIAKWLLDELAADEEWDKRFEQGQEILAELGDEALTELADGKTTEIDPDTM